VFQTKTPYYGYELLIPLKRKGRLEDVYFNFVFQPYMEADESVSGVAVIAYEVTTEVNAQKRIEESESKFRLMAELMPQKVWTCDANGNKTYFNTTLFNYTGMTYDELKGDGWEKVIHPDDWKKNKKLWEESIKTGNPYQSENRMLRSDGKYLWHLTRAVALKNDDGKIKMWVGSKTEIQEQKEQKEVLEKAVLKRTTELQEVNKRLLFEVSEKEKRSEELAKMNKELEAFAYVSSHDLQEPLRKIQTFADLIMQSENLSDNGKKYFSRIEDAATRMRTLIEDLLSFSSLNTTEIKFEKSDLQTIINHVKSDLREIIEQKKATFDTSKLGNANVIEFQFQQLMQNVIGNALKFSRPNIPPHIIISSNIIKGSKIKHPAVLPKKNYCHISIADNGIGFEKEYYDKIFEVFQKLHGKEQYAGTGIGLAIVKKIVENHQGVITVTSELNKGTTFDIYILAD
jgi:two-component system CheB/CheR fusion protein